MGNFVPAAKVEELTPGQMKLVEIDDKKIILVNVDGELYAIDDICTHRECSLHKGDLLNDIIECPCHGGQFNVRTGVVEKGPPKNALTIYPIRIDGGTILVDPE